MAGQSVSINQPASQTDSVLYCRKKIVDVDSVVACYCVLMVGITHSLFFLLPSSFLDRIEDF